MTAPDPSDIIAALAAGETLTEWWPVDHTYHAAAGSDPRGEILIGSVLVQNTAWTQVQRALAALKAEQALDLEAVRSMPAERLAPLVRAAGFTSRKPGTLRALAALVHAEGGLDALAEQVGDDPDPVRRLLLEVHGIGDETADAILAYAFDAPVFVVDAYTRRLMQRLGVRVPDDRGRLVDPLKASYAAVQRWWSRGLPRDAHVLRLAHGAIVRHAQKHCRKVPLCPTCPLAPTCPSAVA